MSPDPLIPEADWQLCLRHGNEQGVDPYLLAAIGLHETSWGTQGDGRPPPAGHGNILGVGSYDSGSSSSYGGADQQTRVGAITLRNAGIHSIDDIRAGKAHVVQDAQGRTVRIIWASADVRPSYPWSTAVIAQWQRLTRHTTPTSGEPTMTLVTFHPGGTFLVCGSRVTKVDPNAWAGSNVPTIDIPAGVQPHEILPGF